MGINRKMKRFASLATIIGTIFAGIALYLALTKKADVIILEKVPYESGKEKAGADTVTEISKPDTSKSKAIDKPTPGRAEAEISAPSKPKAEKTVEADDIIFRLDKCERSGEDVVCYLCITSKIKKYIPTLYIYGPGYRHAGYTDLYDEHGNQYQVSKIRFGATESSKKVRQTLVQDVPVKLTLLFKNVSPQSKSVNLAIACGRRRIAVFHNIPLSDKNSE